MPQIEPQSESEHEFDRYLMIEQANSLSSTQANALIRTDKARAGTKLARC